MKPIIFSTPMVQAILEGRKTQTRRIIKPHIVDRFVLDDRGKLLGSYIEGMPDGYPTVDDSPYQPGDILWVRETWCYGKDTHAISFDPEPLPGDILYKADIGEVDKEIVKWRSPIHMPREAARIFLKVTNVRVERLQDITEEDAKAEGMESEEYLDHYEWAVSVAPPGSVLPTLRSAFAALWDSLNAKRGYSWETNPWVWVIEFERAI